MGISEFVKHIQEMFPQAVRVLIATLSVVE